MKGNKFWAAVSRALAVVTVTLIVTLVLASTAWAAEYKALYKFRGGTDGSYPNAGVILDGAGNLYGTTAGGGIYQYGTAFQLTSNVDGSWTQKTIHNFSGAEGATPSANLIFDATGNLYGTTAGGGLYDAGTVFKLSPNPDGSWSHSVLHAFSGHWTDGSDPEAGLTFDANGNLYGTTASGGAYNYGTVFELTPNPDRTWTEKPIWHFDCQDGAGPQAELIFDAVGNLYGTTGAGGGHYTGTVFKLTPAPEGSWTEQLISTFSSRGGQSYAPLIFDATGNLYGTTQYGGGPYDSGTVFKLTPNPDGSWTKSKVHFFKDTDGRSPAGGVIFDQAGNIYGTTWQGGAYSSGTVFKLTPQPDGHWTLTKLHTFKHSDYPWAGLVMDTAGHLYGTTQQGGHRSGQGVVFKITP